MRRDTLYVTCTITGELGASVVLGLDGANSGMVEAIPMWCILWMSGAWDS
jgi:hypothetical protein